MKPSSDRRKIEIFPSPDELAVRAAEWVVEKLSAAINKNGRVSLVLSGGSTPKLLYKLLASEKYRSKISWDKVLIFFGDERCVPPDSVESNFRMADENLLSHLPIPAENIFRMKGEIDPNEAAIEYEKEIKNALGDSPVFDIVLLGMGGDGHTASLFPETSALRETEKRVAANYVEKLNSWRLTLTLPAINSAKNVLFMVAGKDKANAAKQVFDETSDPPLPSQLIMPENGNLFWLLDKNAASALDGGDV